MTNTAVDFWSGVFKFAEQISPLIAIASGIFGLYLKQRIDRGLEQTKTRFSWLYTARAQAMIDIYARSIAVDESVQRLIETLGWRGSQATLDAMRERYDTVWEAICAFNTSYRPNRLLFSADISKALDDLSALYATIPKFYDGAMDDDVYYQGIEADCVEAVAKNLPPTSALVRTLESEFRKLYGSE